MMSQDETQLDPDRTFAGYRIVREIGRGAMGVVYEAIQEALNRRVALKILPPTLQLVHESVVERFMREAQVIAHLKHENIVAVHEVGVENGLHFFSMDFIEGRNLKEFRSSENPSSDAWIRIFVTVLGALQHAHDRGVIHRDIKPENILVDRNGKVFLTDFGIAKLQGSDTLTRPGAILGSYYYMPPEQASQVETKKIDARSDVYSAGVSLYECLTGRLPFDYPSSGSIVRALRIIQEAQPLALRSIRRDISPRLEAVVLKSIEKRPEDRYATAADFAADLERALRDEAVRAPRSRWLKNSLRKIAQHWVTTAVTFACLILSAIVVWLLLLHLETRQEQATTARLTANRLKRQSMKVSAMEHKVRGQSLLEAGSYADAIAEFESSLILDPAQFETYLLKAQALLGAERAGDAVSLLGELVDADPRSIPARRLRADAYRKLDRNEEAIADLTALLDLAPDRADARIDRGLAYRDLGRNAEAREDLFRADRDGAREPRVYRAVAALSKLSSDTAGEATHYEALARLYELVEVIGRRDPAEGVPEDLISFATAEALPYLAELASPASTPVVRQAALCALGRVPALEAGGPLLSALADEDPKVRHLADAAIRCLTARSMGFDAFSDGEKREKARREWEAWFASKGGREHDAVILESLREAGYSVPESLRVAETPVDSFLAALMDRDGTVRFQASRLLAKRVSTPIDFPAEGTEAERKAALDRIRADLAKGPAPETERAERTRQSLEALRQALDRAVSTDAGLYPPIETLTQVLCQPDRGALPSIPRNRLLDLEGTEGTFRSCSNPPAPEEVDEWTDWLYWRSEDGRSGKILANSRKYHATW